MVVCFLPPIEFYLQINFQAMCFAKVDLDVFLKWLLIDLRQELLANHHYYYLTLLATLRSSFRNFYNQSHE